MPTHICMQQHEAPRFYYPSSASSLLFSVPLLPQAASSLQSIVLGTCSLFRCSQSAPCRVRTWPKLYQIDSPPMRLSLHEVHHNHLQGVVTTMMWLESLYQSLRQVTLKKARISLEGMFTLPLRSTLNVASPNPRPKNPILPIKQHFDGRTRPTETQSQNLNLPRILVLCWCAHLRDQT